VNDRAELLLVRSSLALGPPTLSSTFAAAPQNLCVALAARSDHKPASVGIFLRIPVNVKVF
jgi:hypothetical protein